MVHGRGFWLGDHHTRRWKRPGCHRINRRRSRRNPLRANGPHHRHLRLHTRLIADQGLTQAPAPNQARRCAGLVAPSPHIGTCPISPSMGRALCVLRPFGRGFIRCVLASWAVRARSRSPASPAGGLAALGLGPQHRRNSRLTGAVSRLSTSHSDRSTEAESHTTRSILRSEGSRLGHDAGNASTALAVR